jgi:D-methionine transport system permease protein
VSLHTVCSVPLIVLLAALIPVSSEMTGDPTVPLVLAAIPYFARLVAYSLYSVPAGLIDAAEAMGASPLQIVRRVLLVEARSELVLAVTLLTVSLLAYTALAGGALWMPIASYAQHSIMAGLAVASIVTLVALIGLVQVAGEYLAQRLDRRRG